MQLVHQYQVQAARGSQLARERVRRWTARPSLLAVISLAFLFLPARVPSLVSADESGPAAVLRTVTWRVESGGKPVGARLIAWIALPYGRAGLYHRAAYVGTQVSSDGQGQWGIPRSVVAGLLAVEIHAPGFAIVSRVLDLGGNGPLTVLAELDPGVSVFGSLEPQGSLNGAYVSVAPHGKLLGSPGYFVEQDAGMGGARLGGQAVFEARCSVDAQLARDGTFVTHGLSAGQEIWLAGVCGALRGVGVPHTVRTESTPLRLRLPAPADCIIELTGTPQSTSLEVRVGGTGVSVVPASTLTRVTFSGLPPVSDTIVNVLRQDVVIVTTTIDLSGPVTPVCRIRVPDR